VVSLSTYLKYKTKGDVHMDELRINELNDYQEKALRTWKNAGSLEMRLQNVALGLAGESGEVADAVKKAIHHGHGFSQGYITAGNPKAIPVKEVAKELGDIMYYVSVGAHELGYTLQEIAEININKLANRYPEGFSVEASINRVDTKEAH